MNEEEIRAETREREGWKDFRDFCSMKKPTIFWNLSSASL